MTSQLDGQVTWLDVGGLCGKMYQVLCQATSEMDSVISVPCWKKLSVWNNQTLYYLDCRTNGSGKRLDASTSIGDKSHGDCTMHSGLEYRKDGVDCASSVTMEDTQQLISCRNWSEKPVNPIPSKLSQILELNADEKYYLSAKACQGILTRSNRRGKKLPEILQMALESMMKSDNPNSGYYEADTSKTLDLNGGNQNCNQGGIAVCEPKNFAEKRFFDWEEDEKSVTLRNKGGSYGNGSEVLRCEPTLYDMTHANDVIRDCGGTDPTLQNRMGTGGNQVPVTVQRIIRWIVRRLTPKECERLQGFEQMSGIEGWTDIGEWVDSKGKKHKEADSPRYKALGNSIALPFWYWMFQNMAKYLPEDATLGSLFDGIGGFPLCWEKIHGKGTARWASEIEEFPIAVTKIRFKEE